MSKVKTTAKAIRNAYPNIITIGYCDMQYLLSYFTPAYYTCGIYGWYWMYKAGVTIDDQNVKYGKSAGSKGIICLALTIFGLGIIAYAIIQDDINKICDLASAESTTISAD